MTNLVDPSHIERIVGARRRLSTHVGRLVTAEDTVYILHSTDCLTEHPDLRDCPYSRALDLSLGEHWRAPDLWAACRDEPVTLAIYRGLLVPGTPIDLQEQS